VVVCGRVQGVFFRGTCAAEARAKGLAGWIKNRSDGCVEAEFEGDAPAVDAIIEWCRGGPGLAAVESVEVTWEPAKGEPGFKIIG
jgi:acylphosphatase